MMRQPTIPILATLIIVITFGQACIREKKDPAAAAEQADANSSQRKSPPPSSIADAIAQDLTKEVQAQKPPKTKATLIPILQRFKNYIPKDTVLLVAVDLEQWDDLVQASMMISPELLNFPEEKINRMMDELFAFQKARLGIAVKSANAAMVFLTATSDLGLVFRGDLEYQGAGEGQVEGLRTINLPNMPEFPILDLPGFGLMMYVEGETSLADYVKAMKASESIEEARYQAFEEGFETLEGAWFGAMVDLRNKLFEDSDLKKNIDFPLPEVALLMLNQDMMHLSVKGSEDTLDTLEHMVELGKIQAEAVIGMAKAKLNTLDIFEGSMVIIADHLFEDIFQKLAPKRGDGELVFKLKTQSWLVIPVLGITTAIAIPSFIKYLKKSRASEAEKNVAAISSAAANYFCEKHNDPKTAQPLPPHFPTTDGLIAPQGCCKDLGGLDQDGDGLCDPDITRWEVSPWGALGFKLTKAHYFSYEFKSNRMTANDATFTISAYGDLDCDGVRSTFMQAGKGVVDGDKCDVLLDPIQVLEGLE
jgi:type II secretory pathway pseudopilin PulG